MAQIFEQWKVESESNPNKSYVVSALNDGTYSCACVGWTRHVPRRDCKHIRWVKDHGAMPIDPVLMAMERAQRKVERQGG